MNFCLNFFFLIYSKLMSFAVPVTCISVVTVSPAVIGLHAVTGYLVFLDVHVLAGVHGITAVVGLHAFRC